MNITKNEKTEKTGLTPFPDEVKVSFKTKSGKQVAFCKTGKKTKSKPAAPNGEEVNCPVCGNVHPVLVFKNTKKRNVRTWLCPKIGCQPVMRGTQAQKVIEDEWLVKSTIKSIEPTAESVKPEKKPKPVSHVRDVIPPKPAKAVTPKKPEPPPEPKEDEWEIDDDLLKRWKELVE